MPQVDADKPLKSYIPTFDLIQTFWHSNIAYQTQLSLSFLPVTNTNLNSVSCLKTLKTLDLSRIISHKMLKSSKNQTSRKLIIDHCINWYPIMYECQKFRTDSNMPELKDSSMFTFRYSNYIWDKPFLTLFWLSFRKTESENWAYNGMENS